MSRQAFGDRKSFGKVAKQGVAISFLREGVTELLLFPASMVMARLLSPTEFGISAAALFFVQLSSRLADLGFTSALVRSKTLRPEHLSSVFVVNIGLGILSFAALVASAPLIGRFYETPEAGQIIPIAALSFLITPLGAIPGVLMAREGRFREAAIVEWYYCLTFAAVGIGLAWMGFSFWSLVYARVASVGAQVLCRLYFEPWRPSLRFSRQALGEVLSFAVGMHTKRLLDYTASNFDNLVVGKLMGMTALGLYDKAFSTVHRFLSRMNTGGPTVMFTIFARIHEDPDRFRRAYSKVVMSASLLGFPVFAVLIATAPQLMVVLFGVVWLPAATPFQILCFAGAMKLLNSYAGAATQAAGHIWSEVWRQVAFILLIVAGVYLLRDWGPIGAATGVALATFVMCVLMHVLLKRVTRLSWWEIVHPLVPALLCSFGAAVTVLLVAKALQGAGGPLLLLICQAVAATVFYLAFMLLAPHPGLRALVLEMSKDMMPAHVQQQRWVQWCLKTGPTMDARTLP